MAASYNAWPRFLVVGLVVAAAAIAGAAPSWSQTRDRLTGIGAGQTQLLHPSLRFFSRPAQEALLRRSMGTGAPVFRDLLRDTSAASAVPSASSAPRRAIIVIDPGHGGATMVANSSPNNATGPGQTKEKDLTLDLAVRTAEILTAAGYQVRLTRNQDVNLGLKDRALVAASADAVAFLSIHFNGSANPAIQGSETWTHSASTADSRLLASSIQQRLVGATGYTNRGVKSKGLGVLSLAYHKPSTAACLAEVSFLTNAADETRLQQTTYRGQIASALATGIRDFLEQATSITPVTPVPSGDPSGDGDI